MTFFLLQDLTLDLCCNLGGLICCFVLVLVLLQALKMSASFHCSRVAVAATSEIKQGYLVSDVSMTFIGVQEILNNRHTCTKAH